MAVRSKTHKYIWKEWQDLEDLTSTGNIQLYDLKIDPEEKNNIALSDRKITAELHNVVAKRLAEIPEYCQNRSYDDLRNHGVDKYL